MAAKKKTKAKPKSKVRAKVKAKAKVKVKAKAKAKVKGRAAKKAAAPRRKPIKRKPAKAAVPAAPAAPAEPAAPAPAASDWRSELLDRLRAVIAQAAPGAVEERKWRKASNPDGVPTWSQHGIICTGETYKSNVKLTFACGASLQDPAGLFNSSLEGNERRAIDFAEGATINEEALAALVRAAVELNEATAKQRAGGG